MTFTGDEVRRLLEAIERAGWEEARLVTDEGTLTVSRSGERTLEDRTTEASDTTAARPRPDRAAAPSSEPDELTLDPSHTEAAAPHDTDPEGGDFVVTAPSLGLFWRSPKPGAPPFVEVGDRVEEDSTICIVEVMKLMNHVKAGVAGTVVSIHAENGAMVEFHQPLVSVRPDGA